jgi:hypothetical protein
MNLEAKEKILRGRVWSGFYPGEEKVGLAKNFLP